LTVLWWGFQRKRNFWGKEEYGEGTNAKELDQANWETNANQFVGGSGRNEITVMDSRKPNRRGPISRRKNQQRKIMRGRVGELSGRPRGPWNAQSVWTCQKEPNSLCEAGVQGKGSSSKDKGRGGGKKPTRTQPTVAQSGKQGIRSRRRRVVQLTHADRTRGELAATRGKKFVRDFG